MNKPVSNHDDMQDEYDFSSKTAVQGNYYRRLRNGYSIKVITKTVQPPYKPSCDLKVQSP